MSEQELCQGCNQRHQCQEVYRQVGKAQGPSVAFKAVSAFLLPILVFIAALAVFEGILAEVINTKGLQTAFSLLAAVTSAFVCILIMRAINRQLSKNK